MPGGYCYLLHPEQVAKGAYHRVVSKRRHEAGRLGRSLPLLSLPVRDASRRRRPQETTTTETTKRRHEAGRLGRSLPLLSLPVRDASRRRRPQETTTTETTKRRHEAGRLGRSLPLLSLPVRDASRRRRPQRRQSDGTSPGAWDEAFPSSRSQSGMRAGDDDRRDNEATAQGWALGMETPPPLAPSQGCEQGTMMAVPREYQRDEQIRSVLGRADPEQGPRE